MIQITEFILNIIKVFGPNRRTTRIRLSLVAKSRFFFSYTRGRGNIVGVLRTWPAVV